MDNAQKIWGRLRAAGLTQAGAAGLMGNLQAESGLKPDNLQNSFETKLGYTDTSYTAAVDSGAYKNFSCDSAGYGIAQWTYHSRKAALLAYAKANGKSIGDLDMQLGFLLQELASLFPAVLAKLKITASVQEASDCVLLQFERPSNQGETVKAKRAGYAQEFYNRFVETGGGSMTAVERLIAAAKAQVGYIAKKSNAQLYNPTANTPGLYNKFARDLDALGDFYNGRKNGYDWCDVFVDWCFVTTFGRELGQKLLCQPNKSCGAGTGYSLNYYKAKGQFYTSPKPGDQIFFGDAKSTWHTGIVEKVEGSYVYTIEGNCGKPSAVRTCKYPLTYGSIKGYGRPNWSLVPTEQPTPAPAPAPEPTPAPAAQTDKEDNMKYYKTLADVPASYQETIKKLMECGALKGRSDPDPTRLDDNILDVSEDYCRIMTTLDRLGKLG